MDASATHPVRTSRSTKWARATRSGVLHLDVALGAEVEAGQPIATVHDPFGKRLGTVRTRAGGMIIGHTMRPLVNRADAILHVAELD